MTQPTPAPGATAAADGADGTDVRVIDLSQAPGAPEVLRVSRLRAYSWNLVELALVSNRLQISSRLRVAALRWYGAKVGSGVVFRPRTRVKSPWNLEIGDRCWIGDGVWFHNRDKITVGHDVVISQETYLTTGSHDMRGDMGLRTRTITVEPGAWLTSRCVVLGGAHIGRSAVISPLTVVKGEVPANAVFAAPDAVVVGSRFPDGAAR